MEMGMTSWALYIDDSRDGGLYILGSYMAPSDAWSGSFTPAWRRVLDGGRQPVPEFKASDCGQGRRSFKEWSREERTALTSQLVAVLVEPQNRVFGVACAVLVPRAHELKLRHAFERFSYAGCLITLLAESLKIAKQAADCNSLHIYLDEQAKVAHLVPMAFESSQRLYAAGFAGSLAPARVSEKHRHAAFASGRSSRVRDPQGDQKSAHATSEAGEQGSRNSDE